jgi:hypothetical protein
MTEEITSLINAPNGVSLHGDGTVASFDMQSLKNGGSASVTLAAGVLQDHVGNHNCDGESFEFQRSAKLLDLGISQDRADQNPVLALTFDAAVTFKNGAHDIYLCADQQWDKEGKCGNAIQVFINNCVHGLGNGISGSDDMKMVLCGVNPGMLAVNKTYYVGLSGQTFNEYSGANLCAEGRSNIPCNIENTQDLSFKVVEPSSAENIRLVGSNVNFDATEIPILNADDVILMQFNKIVQPSAGDCRHQSSADSRYQKVSFTTTDGDAGDIQIKKKNGDNVGVVIDNGAWKAGKTYTLKFTNESVVDYSCSSHWHVFEFTFHVHVNLQINNQHGMHTIDSAFAVSSPDSSVDLIPTDVKGAIRIRLEPKSQDEADIVLNPKDDDQVLLFGKGFIVMPQKLKEDQTYTLIIGAGAFQGSKELTYQFQTYKDVTKKPKILHRTPAENSVLTKMKAGAEPIRLIFDTKIVPCTVLEDLDDYTERSIAIDDSNNDNSVKILINSRVDQKLKTFQTHFEQCPTGETSKPCVKIDNNVLEIYPAGKNADGSSKTLWVEAGKVYTVDIPRSVLCVPEGLRVRENANDHASFQFSTIWNISPPEAYKITSPNENKGEGFQLWFPEEVIRTDDHYSQEGADLRLSENWGVQAEIVRCGAPKILSVTGADITTEGSSVAILFDQDVKLLNDGEVEIGPEANPVLVSSDDIEAHGSYVLVHKQNFADAAHKVVVRNLVTSSNSQCLTETSVEEKTFNPTTNQPPVLLVMKISNPEKSYVQSLVKDTNTNTFSAPSGSCIPATKKMQVILIFNTRVSKGTFDNGAVVQYQTTDGWDTSTITLVSTDKLKSGAISGIQNQGGVMTSTDYVLAFCKLDQSGDNKIVRFLRSENTDDNKFKDSYTSYTMVMGQGVFTSTSTDVESKLQTQVYDVPAVGPRAEFSKNWGWTSQASTEDEVSARSTVVVVFDKLVKNSEIADNLKYSVHIEDVDDKDNFQNVPDIDFTIVGKNVVLALSQLKLAGQNWDQAFKNKIQISPKVDCMMKSAEEEPFLCTRRKTDDSTSRGYRMIVRNDVENNAEKVFGSLDLQLTYPAAASSANNEMFSSKHVHDKSQFLTKGLRLVFNRPVTIDSAKKIFKDGIEIPHNQIVMGDGTSVSEGIVEFIHGLFQEDKTYEIRIEADSFHVPNTDISWPSEIVSLRFQKRPDTVTPPTNPIQPELRSHDLEEAVAKGSNFFHLYFSQKVKVQDGKKAWLSTEKVDTEPGVDSTKQHIYMSKKGDINTDYNQIILAKNDFVQNTNLPSTSIVDDKELYPIRVNLKPDASALVVTSDYIYLGFDQGFFILDHAGETVEAVASQHVFAKLDPEDIVPPVAITDLSPKKIGRVSASIVVRFSKKIQISAANKIKAVTKNDQMIQQEDLLSCADTLLRCSTVPGNGLLIEFVSDLTAERFVEITIEQAAVEDQSGNSLSGDITIQPQVYSSKIEGGPGIKFNNDMVDTSFSPTLALETENADDVLNPDKVIEIIEGADVIHTISADKLIGTGKHWFAEISSPLPAARTFTVKVEAGLFSNTQGYPSKSVEETLKTACKASQHKAPKILGWTLGDQTSAGSVTTGYIVFSEPMEKNTNGAECTFKSNDGATGVIGSVRGAYVSIDVIKTDGALGILECNEGAYLSSRTHGSDGTRNSVASPGAYQYTYNSAANTNTEVERSMKTFTDDKTFASTLRLWDPSCEAPHAGILTSLDEVLKALKPGMADTADLTSIFPMASCSSVSNTHVIVAHFDGNVELAPSQKFTIANNEYDTTADEGEHIFVHQKTLLIFPKDPWSSGSDVFVNIPAGVVLHTKAATEWNFKVLPAPQGADTATFHVAPKVVETIPDINADIISSTAFELMFNKPVTFRDSCCVQIEKDHNRVHQVCSGDRDEFTWSEDSKLIIHPDQDKLMANANTDAKITLRFEEGCFEDKFKNQVLSDSFEFVLKASNDRSPEKLHISPSKDEITSTHPVHVIVFESRFYLSEEAELKIDGVNCLLNKDSEIGSISIRASCDFDASVGTKTRKLSGLVDRYFNPINAIEETFIKQKPEFQSLSSPSEDISGFALVEFKNGWFAAGGRNENGTLSASVYFLSHGAEKWEQIGSLGESRHRGHMFVIDNELYYAAGCAEDDADPQSFILKSTDGKNWASHKVSNGRAVDMSEDFSNPNFFPGHPFSQSGQVCGSAVALLDGKRIMFVDRRQKKMCNTLEASNRAWMCRDISFQPQSPPERRDFFLFQQSNGHILMGGGVDMNGNCLSDTWESSDGGSTFVASTGHSGFDGCGTAWALMHNDRLMAIGGQDANNIPQDAIWTSSGALSPTPRSARQSYKCPTKHDDSFDFVLSKQVHTHDALQPVVELFVDNIWKPVTVHSSACTGQTFSETGSCFAWAVKVSDSLQANQDYRVRWSKSNVLDAGDFVCRTNFADTSKPEIKEIYLAGKEDGSGNYFDVSIESNIIFHVKGSATSLEPGASFKIVSVNTGVEHEQEFKNCDHTASNSDVYYACSPRSGSPPYEWMGGSKYEVTVSDASFSNPTLANLHNDAAVFSFTVLSGSKCGAYDISSTRSSTSNHRAQRETSSTNSPQMTSMSPLAGATDVCADQIVYQSLSFDMEVEYNDSHPVQIYFFNDTVSPPKWIVVANATSVETQSNQVRVLVDNMLPNSKYCVQFDKHAILSKNGSIALEADFNSDCTKHFVTSSKKSSELVDETKPQIKVISSFDQTSDRVVLFTTMPVSVKNDSESILVIDSQPLLGKDVSISSTGLEAPVNLLNADGEVTVKTNGEQLENNGNALSPFSYSKTLPPLKELTPTLDTVESKTCNQINKIFGECADSPVVTLTFSVPVKPISELVLKPGLQHFEDVAISLSQMVVQDKTVSFVTRLIPKLSYKVQNYLSAFSDETGKLKPVVDMEESFETRALIDFHQNTKLPRPLSKVSVAVSSDNEVAIVGKQSEENLQKSFVMSTGLSVNCFAAPSPLTNCDVNPCSGKTAPYSAGKRTSRLGVVRPPSFDGKSCESNLMDSECLNDIWDADQGVFVKHSNCPGRWRSPLTTEAKIVEQIVPCVCPTCHEAPPQLSSTIFNSTHMTAIQEFFSSKYVSGAGMEGKLADLLPDNLSEDQKFDIFQSNNWNFDFGEVVPQCGDGQWASSSFKCVVDSTHDWFATWVQDEVECQEQPCHEAPTVPESIAPEANNCSAVLDEHHQCTHRENPLYKSNNYCHSSEDGQDTCQMLCKPGYKRSVKEQQAQCSHGSWILPECQISTCPLPDMKNSTFLEKCIRVGHADCTNTSKTNGECDSTTPGLCSFQCDPGYEMVFDSQIASKAALKVSSTLTCKPVEDIPESNSQWYQELDGEHVAFELPPAGCTKRICQAVNYNNAVVTPSQPASFGDEINITCDDGHANFAGSEAASKGLMVVTSRCDLVDRNSTTSEIEHTVTNVDICRPLSCPEVVTNFSSGGANTVRQQLNTVIAKSPHGTKHDVKCLAGYEDRALRSSTEVVCEQSTTDGQERSVRYSNLPDCQPEPCALTVAITDKIEIENDGQCSSNGPLSHGSVCNFACQEVGSESVGKATCSLGVLSYQCKTADQTVTLRSTLSSKLVIPVSTNMTAPHKEAILNSVCAAYAVQTNQPNDAVKCTTDSQSARKLRSVTNSLLTVVIHFIKESITGDIEDITNYLSSLTGDSQEGTNNFQKLIAAIQTETERLGVPSDIIGIQNAVPTEPTEGTLSQIFLQQSFATATTCILGLLFWLVV